MSLFYVFLAWLLLKHREIVVQAFGRVHERNLPKSFFFVSDKLYVFLFQKQREQILRSTQFNVPIPARLCHNQEVNQRTKWFITVFMEGFKLYKNPQKHFLSSYSYFKFIFLLGYSQKKFVFLRQCLNGYRSSPPQVLPGFDLLYLLLKLTELYNL